MNRRITSSMLVLGLLCYVGCYNSVPITKHDLLQRDSTKAVLITTKDSRSYRIVNYSIRNDTIFGKSAQFAWCVAVPLSQVAMFEVQELDGVRTAIASGVGALAIVGLVAAISNGEKSAPPPSPKQSKGSMKLSCPFIYTFDGKDYHLESETFAGAVFKGIERSSYDILYHLQPVDGAYRLKLVNARNETEYTNELKLIVVDHPKGMTVIPDRAGIMHTITNPQSPQRCTDFKGKDVLKSVDQKDGVYWESEVEVMNFTNDQALRDGVILNFKKPDGAKQAKLIVNGKNTRLGYFALENIFRLKGEEKLTWYQQLNSDTAERAKFVNWMRREGMLHVSIWQDGRWVERTALLDVGPGIAKDQIAVLDVSSVAGDILKIKLESTTDLWRIDQAYVDFSQDVAVATTELPAQQAINERGQDVAELLQTSDEKYYVTISDQYADLTFQDIPLQQKSERTYVVKTRGFYIEWFKTDGPANNELVERILTEPLYGSKMLMAQWMKDRAAYEGISEAR